MILFKNTFLFSNLLNTIGEIACWVFLSVYKSIHFYRIIEKDIKNFSTLYSKSGSSLS